ncbi:DUF5329 family protein [Pontibacter akesuensis]|uniref:DUF5329 domain-containing protein n=1 Tax=Pontibacter akesuensis TaxID=388950 RepID=A0A1I7JBS1_9BACT|nr:DUF5329 family protein [Pontibacter akesuensis]GHA71124.1 hypothetical protein GCM10007389_25720 [Pontibacter akesuensis]SFU82645.1 hypothetical protein SAMN04487941_2693 [Pontibacter akesuensis]
MKTKLQSYVLLGFILGAGAGVATPAAAQTTAVTAVKTTAAKYTEEQKVEHLIQLISKMEGATFVRNGSEHAPKAAAAHLEAKWEKHREKIRTARGFVNELASKSGMTGEPYKIRFADGTEKTTNEVLLNELKRLE